MIRIAAALRPAVVAAIAFAAFLATQDEKAAATSRPAAPKASPLVVITGNEHGFIRPCGCSKPVLGGVHRRAYALAELRKTEPNLAAVSVGEFLLESDKEQDLKFDSFLLSLAEMDYAAFVPGAGEFRLGKTALSGKRNIVPGLPFVVANAGWKDEPPLEKSVKLGDTGGFLIGLVGPLPTEYGATVTPAGDALRAEAEAHAGAAFLLVVYNGPEADLPKIAPAVPEKLRGKTIFAVPGIGDLPLKLNPVLGMPVVGAGMKGKAIGLLRPNSERFYESRVLEEKMPGLKSVEEILESYRRAVRDEGLMVNVGKTPAAAGYVGDQKCAECHEAIYKKLKTTPHQHAVKDLKKTNDHFDPECVQCHVTGWKTQGGFVDYDKTPLMMNVNCEACHGPGSAHSANAEVKTLNGKIDQYTCLHCHDPDNSPQFKFADSNPIPKTGPDGYWPRIEHSLKTTDPDLETATDSKPARGK